MLQTLDWYERGERIQVGERVRYCDRLPGVFAARMRQLETIHHWLADFFQAVAIMLQIPGGVDFQYDEEENEIGDAARDLISKADRHLLLNILAECFERLSAPEGLIHQVPGGRRYKRRDLPTDFRLTLAGQDTNGLLNIVAECLDRLLVIPHLKAATRRRCGIPEPSSRWRRCWSLFRAMFSRISEKTSRL